VEGIFVEPGEQKAAGETLWVNVSSRSGGGNHRFRDLQTTAWDVS